MITPTLSLAEVQNAAAAADEFVSKHGDCGVPYEMLMLFCFVKATAAPAAVPRWSIGQNAQRVEAAPAQSSAPEWFAEGVKQFAGKKLTASAIMSALGKPTDIKSLREAGMWLRHLYGEPLRSNGQTLFAIFGNLTGAAARIEPDGTEAENPFADGVPPGARALAFAAENTGRYKADEIARLVRLQGTVLEATEIGRALTKHGFPYDAETGYFEISRRT